MADPVSWFLIEPGWKVYASGGEEVGSVDEVVGDDGNDIFNGLSVATSLLGRPRYVPAEQVATITEGRIALRLTKDEVQRLGEFEEPATSVDVLPEDSSRIERAEADLAPQVHRHEERLNILTRIRHAFRRRTGR